MVVSPSWTYAPCHGDLTLGSAELEEAKSLHILGVTLNSKLTFKTHLSEVMSKEARRLGVERRVGKLFDCPRVLKCIYMFYPAGSIVPPCNVSSTEPHLVCWIVLFTVQNFV